MPEIDGYTAPSFEPVAEAFAANFAEGAEVGAAVSVFLHGRPVVDLRGGLADPATGRPWERDTTQIVYSTTKAATAVCALLLVQRGELDLDAPVARYWPEFAAEGKQDIPVRWLLTHQAGLVALDSPVARADALAWHPMAEALAAQRPQWRPGTQHGYHALTFGRLVGEVVRRVSGRSLGTFFRDEIAQPLGLDFHIGLPKAEQHRVSRLVQPELDLDAAAFDIDHLPEPIRAIAAATTGHTSGPDLVTLQPFHVGLGFGLPAPATAWHSPTSFGFTGLGGSLGYADPTTGIAFGYVVNNIRNTPTADQPSTNLVTALRSLV
ncbi:serine hydrolase domain-containing protein [Actinosynnema sp. NPDC023794]